MKKRIVLMAALIIGAALSGQAVHAEEITHVEGDVVTLDTGDQLLTYDRDVKVGDTVEQGEGDGDLYIDLRTGSELEVY